MFGDETRKNGKTYQTFLASNEEKEVFFLGLRDMHNKAASTTLDTFKDILNDISSACEEMIINEDVSVGHIIINNIQSFISNRAKIRQHSQNFSSSINQKCCLMFKRTGKHSVMNKNSYAAKVTLLLCTSSTCKYGRVYITYS